MSSGSESTTRRRQPLQGVFLALALVLGLVQFMVLAGTFFMGLGWGGFTWLAALLQALAGFWAIALLARRRSWLVLAVPVLSVALTAGLVTLGGAVGDVGA